MKQDEKQIMDELKREYESIPVPPQARARIMQGINQAKKEQKRGNYMKIMKSTGATAAAAMVMITVMANLNPTTASAMEKLPVIGSIAKVVTFRTFEDQKENFEANIQVPQVTLDGNTENKVNKSIEEYADELIAQYEKELAADQGEGHYSLDSSYKVVTDNDKYLCLRIDTTEIMASGAQFVKIFTVDKATGNVISLKDLFANRPDALDKISENIKEQMRSQMAEDENKQYFLDSDMPETDFKGLTGDESFYFDESGQLVIAFNEYDVAPGYMGAVDFTIPKTVTGKL